MLKIENLSVSYGERKILDQVSFSLEKGKVLSILGNNGVGKSTLLKSLVHIVKKDAGAIHLDETDIDALKTNERARKISYCAQMPEVGKLSVFETVLIGRKPHMAWAMGKDNEAIVEKALLAMGLEHLALRPMDELSGGEVQRVMLCRALVQEPQVLLLDEPTSSLDPKAQQSLMQTVRKAAAERGISVITVLHDLNLALRYSDEFLLLSKGKVYSHGGVETITEKAIRDVYGMEADIIEHDGKRIVIPK